MDPEAENRTCHVVANHRLEWNEVVQALNNWYSKIILKNQKGKTEVDSEPSNNNSNNDSSSGLVTKEQKNSRKIPPWPVLVSFSSWMQKIKSKISELESRLTQEHSVKVTEQLKLLHSLLMLESGLPTDSVQSCVKTSISLQRYDDIQNTGDVMTDVSLFMVYAHNQFLQLYSDEFFRGPEDYTQQ
jgi:hypothetical protein